MPYAKNGKIQDSTSESSLPTMQQMLTFLQRRAQLEEMKPIQINNKPQSKNENNAKSHSFIKSVPQHAYLASESKLACFYCKGEHAIYSCEKLLPLSAKERLEEIKKASLCTNCLRPNHKTTECHGGSCRKCGKRHNSLLHFDETITNSSASSNSKEASVINMQAHTSSHTFVSTAIVYIMDNQRQIPY